MIRMLKGTYGLEKNGTVEAMTKHSGPFSLPESREAELIAAGVAEKVEYTAARDEYEGMKMTELRALAASMGKDASRCKTKKAVIGMIRMAEEAQFQEDNKLYSGLFEED